MFLGAAGSGLILILLGSHPGLGAGAGGGEGDVPPPSGVEAVEDGVSASQDPLASFTAWLDRRLPALMEAHRVPGVSVALVHDGERVWSRAYGMADPARGLAMTLDAVYRAEAISKSLTAWGVMRLVQRGRIGLDDPVAPHLTSWAFPDSPFPVEEVTVRRLLGHTAGLPLGPIGEGYPPEAERPSLREHLTAHARLARRPGSEFDYSNVGYHLLELLIEEVTGQDFGRYMEEEILAPLGMRFSSFDWSPELGALMPVGHDLRGNPVPPYVYPGRAAGGLLATVEDVARFVAAGLVDGHFRDQGPLSAESLWEVYTPLWEQRPGVYDMVADGYGLGHLVEYIFDGRQAVFNGGPGHGWMTHFHSVPESGAGMVILTNSQRSWPLISEVVAEWAEWEGFGRIGMGRIALAATFLWGLVGLIGLVALWEVVRVTRGLLNGRRRFAPFAGGVRMRTVARAAIVAMLAGGLWWSATGDHLILISAFPAGAGWLWGAVLGLAVILLLSTLFPRRPAGIPADAVGGEEVMEPSERALNVKPLE
jgi:CubicO group peptidase (beta-lactamase class C family)